MQGGCLWTRFVRITSCPCQSPRANTNQSLDKKKKKSTSTHPSSSVFLLLVCLWFLEDKESDDDLVGFFDEKKSGVCVRGQKKWLFCLNGERGG